MDRSLDPAPPLRRRWHRLCVAGQDTTKIMLALVLAPQTAALPGHVAEVASFEVLGTSGSSSLYAIHLAPDMEYSSGSVELLDLHGSRREQGNAFGVLGGKATKENYDALIGSLIDTKTAAGLLEKAALV